MILRWDFVNSIFSHFSESGVHVRGRLTERNKMSRICENQYSHISYSTPKKYFCMYIMLKYFDYSESNFSVVEVTPLFIYDLLHLSAVTRPFLNLKKPQWSQPLQFHHIMTLFNTALLFPDSSVSPVKEAVIKKNNSVCGLSCLVRCTRESKLLQEA